MRVYSCEFWTQPNNEVPRILNLYRTLEPLEIIKHGPRQYDTEGNLVRPYEPLSLGYLSGSDYDGNGFTITLKKQHDVHRFARLVAQAQYGVHYEHELAAALMPHIRVWSESPGVRYRLGRWLDRYRQDDCMRYTTSVMLRTARADWNNRRREIRERPLERPRSRFADIANLSQYSMHTHQWMVESFPTVSRGYCTAQPMSADEIAAMPPVQADPVAQSLVDAEAARRTEEARQRQLIEAQMLDAADEARRRRARRRRRRPSA